MAVTLRDVALLAGTSTAAVSATLNGGAGKSTRVGPATRQRIMAAAAQLGYVTNPIAQSLATGRTGVIGLMLPYRSSFLEHDPFITNVMNGMFEEAVRRRYNVMLYTATSEEEGEGAATMVDSRVDGVIHVIPAPDSPVIKDCLRRKIPTVSILREPTCPEEFVVNSDDHEGGRLATEHLLSLGHRRIAHLGGYELVTTTAGRRRGYMDAMDSAGITVAPKWLVTAGFSREGGFSAMSQLLDLPAESRPTAVFCANDLCAHGAIQAISQRGLSIPDDVAVVGYDDTWYSTMTDPPLTTVNMAIGEIGLRAAQLLIDQLERRPVENRQPVLPVTLTVRQSCGATLR